MDKPRARHLFAPDGRTVIVALDHAAYHGPLPGLEYPARLLDAVARAGADAVLTTYGVAARFHDHLGRLGLMLRADGGVTRRGEGATIRRLFRAEDALRLGADGVACMGLIGQPTESESLANLSELVGQCAEWGLPVLAEMLVQPANGTSPTPDDVAFAARIGAEMGADLIKIPYVGPAAAFRAVIQQCPRPIVVLGGEKTTDAHDLLTAVAGALDAGAAGVAIGRNVWQHADPEGVTMALVALVHDGATVDQALQEIA